MFKCVQNHIRKCVTSLKNTYWLTECIWGKGKLCQFYNSLFLYWSTLRCKCKVFLTWWHPSPGSSELRRGASGCQPGTLHTHGHSALSAGSPARAMNPPGRPSRPRSWSVSWVECHTLLQWDQYTAWVHHRFDRVYLSSYIWDKSSVFFGYTRVVIVNKKKGII